MGGGGGGVGVGVGVGFRGVRENQHSQDVFRESCHSILKFVRIF